jgi:hypothetical protein
MQIFWTMFPYLIQACIVLIPLSLVFAVDFRVRRLGKSIRKCDAAIQAEAAQLTNAINELKRRMAELESGTNVKIAEPQESGLGDIARGKVLKMHRVGRDAGQIAETLGLPKGEVDLLVKVHKIVMKPYQDVAPTR